MKIELYIAAELEHFDEVVAAAAARQEKCTRLTTWGYNTISL